MNQIHVLSKMLAMQASGASEGGQDEPAAGAGLSGPEDYSAEGLSAWAGQATSQLMDLAVAYAPRLLLAVVVLVVGWIVVGFMQRGIRRVLGMRDFDATVGNFLGSVAGIALKVMLLLSVAGMVGIEVTSFIAILSAATLAIGMALKGTLSNFAGGVSVMLFRPYKVGDFIEGAGQAGSVKEIQIFNTVLTTGDNRTVIIPNNSIATGVLVNYSTQPTRRVEIVVGIGYEDDIDVARGIVQGLVDADDRIHRDPAPMIVVGELGASSVDLKIRVWTGSGDFWPVTFDLNERIKKAFDAGGINIPYPQQVVHHVHENAPEE
ncbi:MAG: mechanosensitive ion channel domain-containing protein [Planctomycetota bacterium]|nr:mechanosensitive ion channel domain-containing protein [Planctomycetota bacterium]